MNPLMRKLIRTLIALALCFSMLTAFGCGKDTEFHKAAEEKIQKDLDSIRKAKDAAGKADRHTEETKKKEREIAGGGETPSR